MRRAYGWNLDGTLRDNEADELRAIADQIINGRPITQIVKELAEREVTTSRGNRWSVPSLTRALRNPRMIGHKLGRTGELVPRSDIEPILTVEQYKQLDVIFEDPERKKSAPKSKSSMLAGLVWCARDNRTMPRSGPVFRCADCQSSASTETTETEVVARVLARIGTPIWQAAIAGAVAAGAQQWRDQIRDADDRMLVLAETFGALGDRAALDAGVAAARKSRADAEVGLALTLSSTEVDGLTDEQLVQWWAEASSQDRRALVAVVLDRVMVSPAEDGLRGPDRLVFEWR